MKKLLIATPIHDSKPFIAWTESVERATRELRDVVEIEMLPGCGDSLIANARNILVGTFLYENDADAMLFVDADEGFTPRDVMAIVRGIDAGFAVVGAAYAKKLIDWELIRAQAQDSDPGTLPRWGSKLHNFNVSPDVAKSRTLHVTRIPTPTGDYDYIDVEFCGTGFLGISRFAASALSAVSSSYEVQGLNGGRVRAPALFADGVVGEKFVGEDVHFCKLVRKYWSIKLFVDSRVTHWGLYEHPANARGALEAAGFEFEVKETTVPRNRQE